MKFTSKSNPPSKSSQSFKELLEGHINNEKRSIRSVAINSGISERTLYRWCSDPALRIQKKKLPDLLKLIGFLSSIETEESVDELLISAGFPNFESLCERPGFYIGSKLTTIEQTQLDNSIQVILRRIRKFVPIADVEHVNNNVLDGKSFKCYFFNIISNYPAIIIKQSGLDHENGFTLELFPYDLDDQKPEIDFLEIPQLLINGELDCLIDTFDGIPLQGNYGTITAVVGQSLGADQIWTTEPIRSLQDLKGKKIGYVEDSVSEYFLLHVLFSIGITSEEIIPITSPHMSEVTEQFLAGETDAVVVWGNEIEKLLQQSKAFCLIDSSSINCLMDVIVIGKKALHTRRDAVQAFHRAWFQASKMLIDDPLGSAELISSWGHPDWTMINVETCMRDLLNQQKHIALASLGVNITIMENLNWVYDHLQHARFIAEIRKRPKIGINVPTSVDPQFVLNLKHDESLYSQETPYNPNFGLEQSPSCFWKLEQELIMALEPHQVIFEPGKETPTPESLEKLLQEILPIIKRCNLKVHVIGSAAWPGTVGQYSEADIIETAIYRAKLIGGYLTNWGISPTRLVYKSVLPPQERRSLPDDSPELVKDRVVRFEFARSKSAF